MTSPADIRELLRIETYDVTANSKAGRISMPGVGANVFVECLDEDGSPEPNGVAVDWENDDPIFLLPLGSSDDESRRYRLGIELREDSPYDGAKVKFTVDVVKMKSSYSVSCTGSKTCTVDYMAGSRDKGALRLMALDQNDTFDGDDLTDPDRLKDRGCIEAIVTPFDLDQHECMKRERWNPSKSRCAHSSCKPKRKNGGHSASTRGGDRNPIVQKGRGSFRESRGGTKRILAATVLSGDAKTSHSVDRSKKIDFEPIAVGFSMMLVERLQRKVNSLIDT